MSPLAHQPALLFTQAGIAVLDCAFTVSGGSNNPINENIIAFLIEDDLPEEFGLHKYIDYKLHYNVLR